jgi:SNF2 family DNA or RNA helicase
MVTTRAREAALMTPWSYAGSAGLEYSSPLGQVHWRRLVLDEGHSVKNAAAECSQQSTKILARCRYLMSGTPDLKGQAK